MQTKVKKNIDPLPIQKLSQRGKIGQLVTKVNLISSLSNTLFELVSPELRPQCNVINLDGFTIIIGCHSSHVANLLYYQQNNLISTFKQRHPELSINRIRVKVQQHANHS